MHAWICATLALTAIHANPAQPCHPVATDAQFVDQRQNSCHGAMSAQVPVAVKKLKPHVINNAIDLREFLSEANTLRRLKHRYTLLAYLCTVQHCALQLRVMPTI